LRAAPEDVPATFKRYRNLDALYDVLGSVVEGAGAFGSKDDLQALSNDLNSFEGTRKQIAERIESLSSAKESEIVRLRKDLKTAQAAIPATPPAKIVVDDNAPPKKPAVKKKPVAKPGTTLLLPGQRPKNQQRGRRRLRLRRLRQSRSSGTADLGPRTSDLRPQTSDLGPQTSDLGPRTSVALRSLL